ncbi:hypothetical protein SAMN02746041_03246 [Desulfacinum hydrothermale DSM 13146]|uniref:Ribbon-helix-helix protein, copG family n=1 Tax=Desulfacinum hydrothermale DSM 13146 TaxID=1121390 RepID=A0A1W1XWQ8_9BACT|nr:hypothetical protein [Desulfacinum hydrothermale]SMC28373.1 hypothetical protein SAMN02746041_03246 [Desulfacinum hydrothermale DSM 13146]
MAKRNRTIPETSRINITLDRKRMKEVKKLAIDLEISEKEVVMLAVESILQKYRSLSPDEVYAKGRQCFVNAKTSAEMIESTNRES